MIQTQLSKFLRDLDGACMRFSFITLAHLSFLLNIAMQ